jgi:hypothetical protein
MGCLNVYAGVLPFRPHLLVCRLLALPLVRLSVFLGRHSEFLICSRVYLGGLSSRFAVLLLLVGAVTPEVA